MELRPVCEMQFIDFISTGYDMLTNYVATARYRAMLRARWWCVAGGGYVRGGPFHRRIRKLRSAHPRPEDRVSGDCQRRQRIAQTAFATRTAALLEHKYLYRRIKEELPPATTCPFARHGIAREARRLDHHLRGDGVEGARAAEQVRKKTVCR